MKQDINNERVAMHRIRQKCYPVALSIAGSDSSGGAGIQADLKTFSALGVYGATVITAVTAQNTQGVHSQFAIPPQMVYDQIVSVVEDIAPAAIKIGMLSNVAIVNVVADALARYNIPIILDPVMVSTSGHNLLSNEAREVIIQRLFPMATLITPNIPEMSTLAAMPLTSAEEKMIAAQHLIGCGARAILLKSGHETGDTKVDTLYQKTEDGIDTSYFSSPTIATRNTHGTGCTLSSAIAAFMARGCNLEHAVGAAKEYICKAIAAGADVVIGRGFGPVNHLFDPLKLQIYDK